MHTSRVWTWFVLALITDFAGCFLVYLWLQRGGWSWLTAAAVALTATRLVRVPIAFGRPAKTRTRDDDGWDAVVLEYRTAKAKLEKAFPESPARPNR